MARQAFAPARQQSGGNGGQKWTEAEKLEYERKQARAFRNFAKYFQGINDPKARIGFLAKVIEMSDEPYAVTNNFGTRQVSLVKVELVDPPLAGIRFQMEVTDNPGDKKARATILNDGSVLYRLYRAATGTTPPESGAFSWDTKDILHTSAGGNGRLVLAKIARGEDRDDGKRGGLYSELKDFDTYVAPPDLSADDEDEEEAAPTPPPAPRRAPARREPDPELDDVPF